MGEKVKRGIKLEDGSYTYYYDKSPYPGSKSKQEMINANKETKSGMQKKMSGSSSIQKYSTGMSKEDIEQEGKKGREAAKALGESLRDKNVPMKRQRLADRQPLKKIQKLNKGSKKKMPKARDMAMGNKNIVYLGDPYMVDGEMFDPVKAHPEDYLRPEGADNYSTGGEINVGKGGDYIKDLID